ncbi:hypothetical protein ACUXST_001730 [Sphingomonas sp. F9_3S_D5_B_2]
MSELEDERGAGANRCALRLITEAMDTIDGHDLPPDASAHLAMALQILRSHAVARSDASRKPLKAKQD